MLTFLRRLRRSLIGSGSVQKYILYAMGEILLVMIGILLALQVNNWNEWRKERNYEIQTLMEIAENIEMNIEVFEDYISGGDFADFATDYVLAILNKEKPYSDSLHHIINSAIYQRNIIEYSTLAYESLKNNNINLIQNQDLKNEIISLFELSYPSMEKNLNWENTKNLQEYMDHHFYPKSTKSKMFWIPYDFNVQMNDNYFKSLIAKVKIQRNYYKWSVQAPLSESKRVLELVNEELEK